MDFAPKLRDVEAFPVEHDGQRCIALRDPAGYTDAVVLLPPGLLEIVSLFDGQHSMAEIQAALGRRYGASVPPEPIERAARSLDEHGFLDSAGFASRRTAIDAALPARPPRPAAHAGGAYPGAAADVHAAFDALFTPPDGPGPVDGASSGATAVRGVIAPHIDFHRGGPAYAWAYRDGGEGPD